MEWKIGEIKQINGEWYQCMKELGCDNCDFLGTKYCSYFECSSFYRVDKIPVIFKKLEKVGEPYEFDGRLFQSYRTFEVPIFTENYATVRELGNNSKISIEIKQIKEDMGDLDKIKVRDYTKVEELNVMEEKKLNLKPFDIQKAREGKPVFTRDGRKARIICWNIKDKDNPIAAAVFVGECESVYLYTNKGEYNKGGEDELDLMMLPEKKEGWVNVYKGSVCISVYPRIYKSREEAVSDNTTVNRIDTVKISWEE